MLKEKNKKTIKKVMLLLVVLASLSFLILTNNRQTVELKEINFGDFSLAYDSSKSTVTNKDLDYSDGENKQDVLRELELVYRDSKREHLRVLELANASLKAESLDDILSGYYQEKDASVTNIYGLDSKDYIVLIESYGTYTTSCGAQIGADFTISAYPKENTNKKCYIGIMSYVPDDKTIFNKETYEKLIEAFVKLTSVDIKSIPDFDKAHETLREQYKEYDKTLNSLMG